MTKRSQSRIARLAVAIICLAVGLTYTASAQGHSGPPPGGGMGGPQFPGGGPGQPGPPPGGPPRAGLQLGPPGQRWWDDQGFVRSLKLRAEQRAKMDFIFEQNRAALRSRFDGVQQAEAQMQQLSNAPALDEAALFVQIDRVAQARADLEKATTHMLLQIRKEMDPDQIKLLQSQR